MDYKPTYNRCIAIYYSWFQEKKGFKPRIDKSDGEGLRKTAKYLLEITNSEDDAVNTFEYILNNWEKLPNDYYKSGIRLRQINGNLVNILDFFKNKNETGVSESYLRDIASKLA